MSKFDEMRKQNEDFRMLSARREEMATAHAESRHYDETEALRAMAETEMGREFLVKFFGEERLDRVLRDRDVRFIGLELTVVEYDQPVEVSYLDYEFAEKELGLE